MVDPMALPTSWIVGGLVRKPTSFQAVKPTADLYEQFRILPRIADSMLGEKRASPIYSERGIHVRRSESRGYAARSDGFADQADCVALNHRLIVSGSGVVANIEHVVRKPMWRDQVSRTWPLK